MTNWQVQMALRYASQHTDFHIDKIKEICDIKPGRYEDTEVHAILREVRDIAPFSLFPVWERQGYWSSNTSAEVRRWDAYEAAKQDAARWRRKYDIHSRFHRGTALAGYLESIAVATEGWVESLQTSLPNPNRTGDHCLNRIDSLIQEYEVITNGN